MSARGAADGVPAAAASAAPPFELPEELRIDTDVARRVIGGFVRGQLKQAGFERAVLGLSGGIDSAVVAYLVAEAIGAERLLCVLLPYRTSSPASRADAEEVVRRLGCASRLVDISPIVDGYFRPAPAAGAVGTPGAADPRPEGAGEPRPAGSAAARSAAARSAAARSAAARSGAEPSHVPDPSPLRRGNFMARARMMVLYDLSVTWGGLVVGTGNKTESLIGYTTLFGDSACAFNPIGDLYKTQVRQLALALDVPDAILRKAPSADLWPGQTDEAEAGFTYHELDRLLFAMVDRRRSEAELEALGFDAATIARVDRMVAASEFKRQVPPIAKLGPRTAGVDYLYPRRRPRSARP